MRKILTTNLLLFAFLFSGFAQNTVDTDVSANWISFMNVRELPANGNGYVFGNPWSIPDLKTVIDSASSTITLQPNFNAYDSTDGFWTDPATYLGNKECEASTFVEPGATFNGNDLTFTGFVVSNTIDTSIYDVTYFIKALDPNNGYNDALGGSKQITVPAGGSSFTVSATAAELAAGLIVQYGFTVRGRNGNPANEAALGSVVVAPIALSTSAVTIKDDVTLFPNPNNGLLNVTSNQQFDSFIVRGINGQVLMNGPMNSNQINVSELYAGLHVLELYQNKQKVVKTFVKL